MSFILLNKRNELVISAPISSTANEISESIIYTAIRINTLVGKNYKMKVNI